MSPWFIMAIGTVAVIVLAHLLTQARRRLDETSAHWRWPRDKTAWRPHR